MKYYLLPVWLLLGGCFFCQPAFAEVPALRKKWIECSWSSPTPAYVRQNIRTMERDAPYDGIRIRLEATGSVNGENVECEPLTIFSPVRWKYEWFAASVADLQATEFQRFTDNFLDTGFQPGIYDWFDDAAWEAACANYGLMARIARETGMKGLVVDTESYQRPMFRFAPGPRTYEEVVEQVRRRGRQWGEEVFSAYPDITLLIYYWLSYNTPAGRRAGGDAGAALYGYPGLLVAFINGVYDVMPLEAKIVDGHEDQSYMATTAADFYRMHCDFHTVFAALIAPENQDKFRARTRLGPGLYLDAFFTNRPGDYWYLQPEETDRVKLFRNTLLLALDASDEYVWSWGEQYRWWNFPYHGNPARHVAKHGTGGFWEEVAPGVTLAARVARRESPAVAEYIAQSDCESLVINGDFSTPATAEKPVPAWSYWEDEGISAGEYRTDEVAGGVVFEHTAWGLLEQSIPVTAGHLYAVRAYASGGSGESEPALLINWMDAGRKVIRSDYNRCVVFAATDGEEEKLEALDLVFPPPGVAYMRLLFGVWRQTAADAPMRFHAVQVYDLE